MTMKMLDVTRRGAASNLFAPLLPALLSLPLCLAAGCATEEPSTDTATQGLGASCTVWRPLAWSGAASYCHEGTFTPYAISMPDGTDHWFYSAPFPGMGEGYVRLVCVDGVPTIDPWNVVCIPDQGDTGGF